MPSHSTNCEFCLEICKEHSKIHLEVKMCDKPKKIFQRLMKRINCYIKYQIYKKVTIIRKVCFWHMNRKYQWNKKSPNLENDKDENSKSVVKRLF